MAKRKVSSEKLVVIGGSAGSLDALLRIIPQLRTDMPYPVVLVMHRKSSNDQTLALLLSAKTSLVVKEIDEKERTAAGIIYITPGDYHVLFENDKTLSLDDSEKINYSRPSIDVAFQSAADVYGRSLVCILLSGANADGTEGCSYAKSKGGITIAQSPHSAEVPTMPQNAITNHAIDHVFDINAIVQFLNTL